KLDGGLAVRRLPHAVSGPGVPVDEVLDALRPELPPVVHGSLGLADPRAEPIRHWQPGLGYRVGNGHIEGRVELCGYVHQSKVIGSSGTPPASRASSSGVGPVPSASASRAATASSSPKSMAGGGIGRTNCTTP